MDRITAILILFRFLNDTKEFNEKIGNPEDGEVLADAIEYAVKTMMAAEVAEDAWNGTMDKNLFEEFMTFRKAFKHDTVRKD